MSGYDGRGGKFDIIAVRGADLAFTVTATDSLSAAIDLSAATIAGELYTSTGAVAATLSDAVSGAGSNIITLSATDAQTALWAEASYPWTLWVTRGGDKRPWLAGRVRVVDSSNGVRSTDGDAITLIVDSDVNVSISVLGGSSGGSTDAADITIADVGTYYTGTDVEAALQEVGSDLAALASQYVSLSTPPVSVAGTTDTLAATDNGKVNIYTEATLVTVTLPTDAGDDLADGFECLLVAAGAAGLTLSTAGITLIGSSPNKTIAQNEGLFVKKTATANTWLILGGTAA